MGRTREKAMSRGALLFAFNSPRYNYYAMAEYTAKRINHFLGLPVTIVTDESSIPTNPLYKFDNTIIVEPDKNNIRDYVVWINKGRYQAYELSPYDETLLLDTDYVVNSDRLLQTFDISNDFCCHDATSFLMHPKAPQEILSAYSFNTLWATVITFKKTARAKQIFECLEMVQKNYEHYANIHSFIAGVYRNDYALTLALRIANGHLNEQNDIIPWNLLHVGKNTSVYAESTDQFNTEYTVMFDNWQRGKIRKEYINIKDTDFHVMNKENFLELIKNG
jgi:hypothetical protein